MTAFAAASCVEVRLLKGIPSRQLSPQGRLLHNLALARSRVCTTESCCAVDRVARNALARQTTFATPVSPEQSVVVVVVVLVDELLLLLEPLSFLHAKKMATANMGQPIKARCFRFIMIDFINYTAKIDPALGRKKPIVVNVVNFGANVSGGVFKNRFQVVLVILSDRYLFARDGYYFLLYGFYLPYGNDV